MENEELANYKNINKFEEIFNLEKKLYEIQNNFDRVKKLIFN